MTIPKRILQYIQLRVNYANRLNHYDNLIREWLTKHNIDSTELDVSYGCMVTTEPDVFAEKTKELIQHS